MRMLNSMLTRLVLGPAIGLVLLFCTANSFGNDDWRTDVGKLLPSETVAGEKFSLSTDTKFHVLVFLGVECPVARQYGAKLQPLADQFSGKSIQFIGVNSNPQDSSAEVAKFQQELKIQFPMLKDSSQLLAKRFQVTRTAEVVLIDSQGEVRYQGRIDDQYSPGVARGKTTSHDLREAIAAVVDGKPVANPKTIPVGCVITYKKEAAANPKLTFTKDIAPLLYQNCYECHRSGEIGPFDISDYEDLQGWGEMIVEVMDQKRMPPWHADPQHGSFKNERKLPDGVLAAVRTWVEEGMPYGNPADLPTKPKYVDGWRLPKQPDVVLQMREKPYRIPAEGVVDYQYFVVDPGFTEDKWVSASQIIPGAASVVHHAIVFVRPPDDGEFIGIGWLNAYVPGQKPVVYPDGFARRVPAGSKLVFQMHYTPSGTEAFDVSKIGINFVEPEKVNHQIFTTIAIDQDFEIPPNTANHIVHADMWQVDSRALLLAISPHMHLRGKSFEVFGKKASGVETILKVPHYDFNWQHTYELAQPLPVESFDSISIEAVFDNSKDNPFNPNPDEYVMWGDQTWEEMTLGYFDVAIPFDPNEDKATRSKRRTAGPMRRGNRGKESSEVNDQVQAYVQQMLTRYDSNKDGEISRKEVYGVFRDFGYWQVDRNSDDKITREELESAARGRRGI